MSTQAKLVLLELVSGLLGWAWLLSGAAAIYFAGAAVLSTSPWSRFFWAVGVSAIAKWLAKGFHDNKLRVAYIDQMIAMGMTKEEAKREWMNRYLGMKN